MIYNSKLYIELYIIVKKIFYTRALYLIGKSITNLNQFVK